MADAHNPNDSIESTHLGKQTAFPSQYAPHLLVAVPRRFNREQYAIKENQLPFAGVDAWHAWEVGFLTDTGLPVVGVLKMVYPCESEFLVESKSLKLYLNSFNMEKLGATPKVASRQFVQRVQSDVGNCLHTQVRAFFFAAPTSAAFNTSDFVVLEQQPNVASVPFTEHKEAPHLLRAASLEESNTTVCAASHLLRSNCKITHQPDWGTVFITINGTHVPTLESLLQYIVSFRNENHFHEEVCEMIYKRLWDAFAPNELTVTCIYTRRGGIDICPTRASASHLLPTPLTSVESLSEKLPRQ